MMRRMKKLFSVLSAAALIAAISPRAYAAGQTYIDDTVEAGPNIAAAIAALAVIVMMFAAMAFVVRRGRAGQVNVPWAVLAVVLSALAMLLALIGSSAGTLYSKVEGAPGETVTRFYDALIARDYPTAYACLSDYTSLGLESPPSSDNAALVYEALLDSYEYTLVGEARIDGLKATQDVRFKYLELESLEASVADGVERRLKDIVESRPREQVYDEEDKYLPGVTEEAYSASLTAVLAHADSYYTSTVIEVELTYTNGQWLIVTSRSMLDALMGGVSN